MRLGNLSYVLLVFLLLISDFAFSQFDDNQKVEVSCDNMNWSDFRKLASAELGARFMIYPDTLSDFQIRVESDSLTLLHVLKTNFSDLDYYVSTKDFRTYFIVKDRQIRTQLPLGFFDGANRTDSEKTRKQYISAPSGSISTSKSFSGKTIVIGKKKAVSNIDVVKVSGYLTNSADDKPIIGGTIYITELKTGTATNEFGYFEFKVKPNNYVITFNSLESIERNVSVEINSSGTLNVSLDQNLFELQEVEISSSKTHNVKGTQLGFDKISAKKIKEIPVVLGEQDILKVALLLPGVTSVGEGTSGFNVRGSPTDQNLFYLSHIPIYNTSHLFGFFSAFNADAVDDFKLYKGSIPVKYGGRLSSIFDIKTKKGNMKKFSARGGISPITARILVEGPIVNDKLSYIAGFRSTYSNWVLKLVKDPEVRNSKAYFGDMIIGVDAVVNDKNSLKVTGYGSYDDIKLSNNTSYKFNNLGASIDWYHSFGRKGEMRISIVHSDYNFSESNTEVALDAYTRNYRIINNNVDLNFNLYLSDKHTLSAGLSGVLYDLNRGNYIPYDGESVVTEINFGTEQALESAIYLGDEWKISPLLTLIGGIRYNNYSYLGPNSVFKYQDGAPKQPQYIIDTLNFSKNEVVKNYGGLDFRFAAIYLINPNLSVKASYNRLHQYIFLLSNTIAVSPSDTWKLADYNTKPMVGDQFSAGIYTNIGKTFELSVEAYYKIVNNLVEYKDGADLVTSKYIEQNVLQGELNAMGIEFMLKKPFGKLTGWLNYSYSNSSILVADKITGENINFGKRYQSSYDRPHIFNIVTNYNVSRRLALSGNLSYSTGRPITYPTAIYYLDGKKILHYSTRNEYRIPDYFRLDLAVKLEGNLLSKKLAHSQFIFSVYNVTGRKNAYSVYFKSEDGKINGYKMSIFGTQIYSLTWDFKLGNYND